MPDAKISRGELAMNFIEMAQSALDRAKRTVSVAARSPLSEQEKLAREAVLEAEDALHKARRACWVAWNSDD